MDTTSDYGPVPISRLKGEVAKIFEALEHGRRVLVSRHGEVVAVIQPAATSESKRRYRDELIRFAVSGAKGLSVLTATDFGQGSPSAFIRAAQDGSASLVSRDNRVVGVLTQVTADQPAITESADSVDARERYLAEYERTHPEATAEDFAREVANWQPQLGELDPAVNDVDFSLTYPTLSKLVVRHASEWRAAAKQRRYKLLLDYVLTESPEAGVTSAADELRMLYKHQGATTDVADLLTTMAARHAPIRH